MGKVYISAIEAGIDTDEVTARASDVLVGKTTIDDEGEVVSGTMPDNSTRTSNGNVPALSTVDLHRPTRPADYFVASIDTDGNRVFNICPPKGYYPGNDTNNLGQSFVNVPISTFGTARQNQVLNGISFTSENGFRISGTIPRIANDTQSPLHGPASSSHYRVHLPSNGYYENNDNRPYVLVNVEQICNNLGVDTSKMLDTLQVGTRRGTIAVRGEVQDTSWIWLDSSIGRVIVSFPEGYYRRSNENNAPRIRIPLETVLKSLGLWDQTVFDGASFFGFMKDGAVANTTKIPFEHGLMMKVSHIVNDNITLDKDGVRYTSDSLWCGYRGKNTRNIGFVSYKPIPFWIYSKVRLTFAIHKYEKVTTDISVDCAFLKNVEKETEQWNSNNHIYKRVIRPFLHNERQNQTIGLPLETIGRYTLTFNASSIQEFVFLCFRFEVNGNSINTSGAIYIDKIELLH